MKTKKQWDESGLNFEKFITPNDEVDSEVFYYFLEVLPPRILTPYGFLVGEPANHDKKTCRGLYDSFY